MTERSSVPPHLSIKSVAPERQGTLKSLQPTVIMSRELLTKKKNEFLLVEKTLEHLVCKRVLLEITNLL